MVTNYRDNEIQQNPYLVSYLESIKTKNIKNTIIELNPLDISEVKHLISETLRSKSNVDPLAQIVFEKTKGNPFFVGRFLTALYNKRLLVTPRL
jgi:predicted ATPase